MTWIAPGMSASVKGATSITMVNKYRAMWAWEPSKGSGFELAAYSGELVADR